MATISLMDTVEQLSHPEPEPTLPSLHLDISTIAMAIIRAGLVHPMFTGHSRGGGGARMPRGSGGGRGGRDGRMPRGGGMPREGGMPRGCYTFSLHKRSNFSAVTSPVVTL